VIRGTKGPYQVLGGKVKAVVLAASMLVWAGSVPAQQHAIDTPKSTLTIYVGKSGFFSAFGHAHEIAAPILRGSAEVGEHPWAEVHVNARALRVIDRDVSEKDRAEIQKTMLGPEVLDSERFGEIAFRSSSAESAGAGRWTLRGNLTLHGQTRPVTVETVYKNGHYTGHATVKQTEFGMKPVKVAGGAVRVKDEVRIEFDLQLAP
jgi:hypothetical protein